MGVLTVAKLCIRDQDRWKIQKETLGGASHGLSWKLGGILHGKYMEYMEKYMENIIWVKFHHDLTVLPSPGNHGLC